MTELELARQAFLLTVCERSDAPLTRGYLADKVNAIYRARHVWEIQALLDTASLRIFARVAAGLRLNLPKETPAGRGDGSGGAEDLLGGGR